MAEQRSQRNNEKSMNNITVVADGIEKRIFNVYANNKS